MCTSKIIMDSSRSGIRAGNTEHSAGGIIGKTGVGVVIAVGIWSILLEILEGLTNNSWASFIISCPLRVWKQNSNATL